MEPEAGQNSSAGKGRRHRFFVRSQPHFYRQPGQMSNSSTAITGQLSCCPQISMLMAREISLSGTGEC
jgi:hypothetical protein